MGLKKDVRLIYCSTAAPTVDYNALKHILLSAEAANDSHGITGLLGFGDGRFLQALEGPRVRVNDLYRNILRDTRHSRVELLELVEIEHRVFPKWRMRIVQWDDSSPVGRAISGIMEGAVGSARFDPYELSAGTALRILMEMEKAAVE